MSLVIDLHCHSVASDGSLTPEDLVKYAKSQGVDVMALTDHDNTSGVAAASATANQIDLRLIPGVEISVSWYGQTIHILGLGIDIENDSLQSGLSKLREFRVWRAQEIDHRLAKSGISGALQGARKFAKGEIIGRTHFAHFLVEQRKAKNIKDVFKHFLVNGKPGHVNGEWAGLADAISWITGAGGQAVIAHPARYRLTATKLRTLIGEFKQFGGSGLEVVSGSHTKGDCQLMAKYAVEFDLLASCGSDYHGPENTWIELGKIPPIPNGCVPVWQNWSL